MHLGRRRVRPVVLDDQSAIRLRSAFRLHVRHEREHLQGRLRRRNFRDSMPCQRGLRMDWNVVRNQVHCVLLNVGCLQRRHELHVELGRIDLRGLMHDHRLGWYVPQQPDVPLGWRKLPTRMHVRIHRFQHVPSWRLHLRFQPFHVLHIVLRNFVSDGMSCRPCVPSGQLHVVHSRVLDDERTEVSSDHVLLVLRHDGRLYSGLPDPCFRRLQGEPDVLMVDELRHPLRPGLLHAIKLHGCWTVHVGRVHVVLH
jgi:hypothetical protein